MQRIENNGRLAALSGSGQFPYAVRKSRHLIGGYRRQVGFGDIPKIQPRDASLVMVCQTIEAISCAHLADHFERCQTIG